MPNSILPQDNDGQELFNAISSFFSMFGIGKLFRMCNAQTETVAHKNNPPYWTLHCPVKRVHINCDMEAFFIKIM